MFHFTEIFGIVKKGLCVLLLLIIAWQQWVTFSAHENQFLSPVQFVKQNYGIDPITQYGLRFTEIKKLFKTPTRINYVGDNISDFSLIEGHFALTQYYLAPNLLFRNNTSCDTVLYNLFSTIHFDAVNNVYIHNGWHVVKDFNNGLIVLAK